MGRKEKKVRPPKEKKPSALRRWWASLAPAERGRAIRIAAWTVVTLAACAGSAIGLLHLRSRIFSGQMGSRPLDVQVRLADCPWWMPPEVASELAVSFKPPGASFSDPQLTRKVFQAAQASAWIRSVKLVSMRRIGRAPYGVVEVSADYRQPLARIKVPGAALDEYVDEEGCRLPAHQVPQWRALVKDASGAPKRWACFLSSREVPNHLAATPIHYVQVLGVQSGPPPAGQPWQGSDLGDALKLVNLLRSRPYFAQVAAVDVRNHAGRVSRGDPPMRMFAIGPGGRMTEMRMDRFALPDGDYVVPPEKGLVNLDQYYRQYGTIAGLHEFIDLRLEKLNVGLN